MGPRTERLKRAVHVGRVARRGGLLRVLREEGGVKVYQISATVGRGRPATATL